MTSQRALPDHIQKIVAEIETELGEEPTAAIAPVAASGAAPRRTRSAASSPKAAAKAAALAAPTAAFPPARQSS